MDRLFLQLTVLSFSYIFWLLPEFLVVNTVVPVKLTERPVFWGPPFVLLAPLPWVFLQDVCLPVLGTGPPFTQASPGLLPLFGVWGHVQDLR